MANTIKLAHSNTSGETPDTLEAGEVAINTYNQKIWVGNGSGNTLVFNHASYASSGHTHSVGDGGFTQKNFTTTLKSKLDGIATGATNTAAPYYTSAIAVGDGGLTQKNFTTTLKNKLDGIAAGATNTNATDNNFTNALKSKLDGIAAGATNTSAPYYTSAIAVGDGGLTQKNFTTTLKSKLDGIAAGATNTAAPYYTSAIAVGDGGLTQKNFTSTLKSKLDGIATGATNYSGGDKLNLTGGTLNSGGNDTTLYVQCKNAGRAMVQIGDSTDGTQGTGVLELTQDGSYGGGISYNGDNSPSWAAGESADHITFYRLSNGTRTEVFHYPYSGNTVTFNGQVNWSGGNSGQCVVQDGGFSQKNFTSTLKSKLDGIASGATNTAAPYYTSAIAVGDGGLTQKNFTTTLKSKLDGIASGATNTAAPYYTSAIAVGDGGLTENNFTDALKSKLDGIASGANNYSFPYTVSSNASNSTVVQRSANGYIFANFFNTSPNTITTNIITKLVAESGDDGYMRHADAGSVRAFLNVANGATNTAAPYYTSAISVGDGGLTQKNFTSTLKTKLDGIAAGATNTAAPHYTSAIPVGDGGLTQKNFTSTLKTKLDGIAAGATNTAAPYYTSAISVGDGGLTQKNFTTTLKNKLDGIAAGATNTTDTWRPVEAGGNTLASNETLEFKAGNNVSISESGGEVTINATDTNTWRSISDSVSSTSSSVSASSAAVKSAYDRSWSTLALGTTSSTAHRGDHGVTAYNHSQSAHAPSNAQANRSISDSVTSTSSTTSASSAAAKAAYDRSWPNNHREIYINGSQFLNNSSSGAAFDLRVQSPLTFTYTGNGVAIMGHESGNGQKHLPSGGSTNQFVQYSSAGTGAWATVQWNDLEDINDLTALP